MGNVHPISSHPGFTEGQTMRPTDGRPDLAHFAANAEDGLRALETRLSAVASSEATIGNWQSATKVSKAVALLGLVRGQFTLLKRSHAPVSALGTVVMPLIEALDLLRGAAADLGTDRAPEASSGSAEA